MKALWTIKNDKVLRANYKVAKTCTDEKVLYSSSRNRIILSKNKEARGGAYQLNFIGNKETGESIGMRALYLKWLLGKLDKKKVKKYNGLLLTLFETDFIESDKVPMDVNRARDGIALRKYFINDSICGSEEELNKIILDNCSWLEMIVALADRIDDQIMFDMNVGNRSNKWFWLIIEQMDLDIYDERRFNKDNLLNKLNKLSNREYENGGKNGIFKCQRDVSKVEIWYQMMEYFNENSPKIEF